jgi:hypothetical protein
MSILAVAATQHDTLKAINEQISSGGDGPGMGWLAVGALGLGFILLGMRWWRTKSERPSAVNNAKKLAKEIRKATGMSRRDYWKLKREAERVSEKRGIAIDDDPFLLVLCPSLRGK